ncbi:hypothetical protein K501DRAFT_287503 [Backusella circina FSU 941]|nr:hypothetical protein K501DRAFT_287503 [Backusella circina FSU 941]
MNPSRTDAKKDQFAGNVKDTLGSAVGNERMQAEGQAQHGSGQTQETAANTKGYVEGMADQVAGAVKGAYNSLAGNTGDEAANKAQQKKGEAQTSFNS